MKKSKEKILNENGSSTVEMCLIFPLIIWTVFFMIYLFIGELNQGNAASEVYEKLYNRETYIYNSVKQDAFEEILKNSINTNLVETISFLDALNISVDYINSGNSDVIIFDKYSEGRLQISVSYEEMHPGISNLIKDSTASKIIIGSQEIRDTGNNLRRWQLYGQILSD